MRSKEMTVGRIAGLRRGMLNVGQHAPRPARGRRDGLFPLDVDAAFNKTLPSKLGGCVEKFARPCG